MTPEESTRVLKALSDPSRRQVLQSLLGGPRYVEELAERLALAASTVSFHLKKLEEAGLVSSEKEQFYVVYQANEALLDEPLRALVVSPAAAGTAEERRLDAYHNKVVASFFKNGRLERLPAQYKKRLIVLEAFARDLEEGRSYGEQEMNDLIHRRFEDHCLLRRELVDAGLVERKDQIYRRVAKGGTPLPPPPGTGGRRKKAAGKGKPMKSRKELVRDYKLTEKVAGIYQVRNKKTGRVLIGSSLNLHGPLNRHRLQLDIGSHRSEALQRDWNALGPDAFAFEIVDRVKSDGKPDFDKAAGLKAIEEKWIEKVRPFSEHCYNGSERIRTNVY